MRRYRCEIDKRPQLALIGCASKAYNAISLKFFLRLCRWHLSTLNPQLFFFNTKISIVRYKKFFRLWDLKMYLEFLNSDCSLLKSIKIRRPNYVSKHSGNADMIDYIWWWFANKWSAFTVGQVLLYAHSLYGYTIHTQIHGTPHTHIHQAERWNEPIAISADKYSKI